APLHIFVLQSKPVTIDGRRRLSGRDRKCLPLYGAGFGLRSGRKLIEYFAQRESGVSLGMKQVMQPVDGLAIDLQGPDLLQKAGSCRVGKSKRISPLADPRFYSRPT